MVRSARAAIPDPRFPLRMAAGVLERRRAAAVRRFPDPGVAHARVRRLTARAALPARSVEDDGVVVKMTGRTVWSTIVDRRDAGAGGNRRTPAVPLHVGRHDARVGAGENHARRLDDRFPATVGQRDGARCGGYRNGARNDREREADGRDGEQVKSHARAFDEGRAQSRGSNRKNSGKRRGRRSASSRVFVRPRFASARFGARRGPADPARS